MTPNQSNSDNVDVRLLQREFEKIRSLLGDKPGKGGEPPHISDMSNLSREEIAAQIAAAEARSDTKLSRLEGKIDTAVATILGELHATRDDVKQADQYNRDSRLFILGAILAAVLSLGALAIAMATYGDALFSRGMNVRDVIQSTIKDYQATAPK